MESLKKINQIHYKLDNTYGYNYNISEKIAQKYGIMYDKNKIPYPNINIISNLKENDYKNYKKIIHREINKSIVKFTNNMQIITSNNVSVEDFIKITKMNYDYSINIIRDKYSDINIMAPFVWEKTDTYMLDIFNSITREDVKGHLYHIEYKQNDIVDFNYVAIAQKQAHYVNEYTYQYVSKSNYNKYKQAELYFNSKYKLLNKKLATDFDITINGHYVSRAWMKMYELLVQCNFIENFTRTFTGFHICEAPGNFINAIMYYSQINNKKYVWNAQSLNPNDSHGKNKEAFMDDFGFMKKTETKWDFGVDQSGDILDIENFKYYIEKYKGVDILIGDCGEKWTESKKEDWVKTSVRDLGTCQMLYALNIPRVGGNCIIKTYSGNFNSVFLSMLELMVDSYSKIIFYKSNLNFWSAEVYIVGINFSGITPAITKLTNDFINGSMTTFPKITRYTFDQYVKLSKNILHQTFLYKTFFVYCSLFPDIFEKHKRKFDEIINVKMKEWMKINMHHLVK